VRRKLKVEHGEDMVIELWRRYCCELLNVEIKNHVEEKPCVEGHVGEILRKEVENALKNYEQWKSWWIF